MVNYKFGKGQCTFYPIRLAQFGEKNYSSSEIPKFRKGGPLQTYKLGHTPLDQSYKVGQTPLKQQPISKVEHYFGGF